VAIELAKAYVQIVPSAEGIQGSITSLLGGEASRAGDSAGTVLGSRLVSTMKKVLGGAAIGKFVAGSIGSGAELEQSIGGIETLFKDSAGAVKEAAANAYKTAGLSANAYMEQTTSFAASLLKSLGNNTRAAADVAQMAMTDMSDNANKMGTDMVSIQNAYQGFAKQNYTMLDNLKLGYGGTKTEMERLLADAEKITGIHYDLSSLADVYNAIHVIQKKLEITGTTAQEAETTLSGSFNAMKAAAENVLGNLALGEEMTPSLEALVDTAKTYLIGNLLPAIGNLVSSVPELVATLVPELVATLVPEILQSGTALVQSLSSGFLAGVPQFFSSALPALLAFTDDLRANFGSFVSAGVDMIVSLANGIVDGLPQLFAYIPDIVINVAGLINDNAPKILAGGAALVVALGHGIIQSIPLIVQNAGKIVEAVFSVISAFNWLNLGASLLQSIGNGVKSMGSSLVQAFQSGFTGALQWLKSLPSQVFNIGKDVLQNFIHAITGKGAVATAATVGVQLVRTSESDKDWGLSDEVVDKAEVNAFKVQNLAKQTGSAVSTAASSAAASTEKTAQAAQSVTKTVLSALTDAATSYSSNEYGQITTSVTELTEHIKDSTGKVYDQLTRTTTESGKELVNGVVKNYKLVTKEVTDENGKVTTTTQKTYEDASKSLVSTLTQTAQTLKNGVSTTIESVTKKYQDNSEHIEQTATETGTRIVNGALETYTKVKTLMDGVETDSKETSQAVVSQYDTLNSNYGAAAERVAQLQAAYNESAASTGEFSEQTLKIGYLLTEEEEKLDAASKALKEYQKNNNRANAQVNKFKNLISESNAAFADFGSSLTSLGEIFDSEVLQNAGDFFTTITNGVSQALNFAASVETLVTTLQTLKTAIEAVNATGGISSVVSGIGKLIGAGGATVAAGTAGAATAGAATAGAATAGAATAGTGVAALGLSIPQIGLIVAGVLAVGAVGYGIYKWATKDKDQTEKKASSKMSYKDIQDAYWYGNERAFAGYDYRTDPYTFRQQSTMSDYQNKMQAELARIGEFVEKYLPETGKGVVALDGEEVARIITPSVNANLGQLAVLSGRGN
jgi:phage-related protein